MNKLMTIPAAAAISLTAIAPVALNEVATVQAAKAKTSTFKLKRNAFVYRANGKRYGKKVLKKNKTIKTVDAKIYGIKKKRYVKIGKDQYVKVSNLESAAALKAKVDATIYSDQGKTATSKVVKKGQAIKLYDNKVYSVNNEQFFRIGENEYVKVTDIQLPKGASLKNTNAITAKVDTKVYQKDGQESADKAVVKKGQAITLFDTNVYTINGKQFLRIGDNAYINADDVQLPNGASLKSNNALTAKVDTKVYQSNGQEAADKAVVKKGEAVTLFDQKVYTINGQQFVRIADNSYVNANDIQTPDGKPIVSTNTNALYAKQDTQILHKNTNATSTDIVKKGQEVKLFDQNVYQANNEKYLKIGDDSFVKADDIVFADGSSVLSDTNQSTNTTNNTAAQTSTAK